MNRTIAIALAIAAIGLFTFVAQDRGSSGSDLATRASAGDPAALFELGTLETKVGDRSRGLALWRAAAERGNPGALRELGRALMEGNGVAADLPGAEVLLRQAADAGDLAAIELMSTLYLHASHAPDEALPWLERASAAGSSWAAAVLTGWPASAAPLRWGVAASSDPRALDIEMAGRGDPEAALRVAERLLTADRGPEAGRIALQWIETAAGAGNVTAMRRLGDLHSPGAQFPEPSAALYWYESAAFHGDRKAEMHAALMHVDGTAPNSDPAAGMRSLIKLAREGYTAAQYEAGRRMVAAGASEESRRAGLIFLKDAALAGHEAARNVLREFDLARTLRDIDRIGAGSGGLSR